MRRLPPPSHHQWSSPSPNPPLHPLLVPLHTKVRESPEMTGKEGWGVNILFSYLVVLQIGLACLA